MTTTGPPVVFSDEELERYRGHLTLPEIGEEGQRRLRQASVCVLGVGGLGSPVAMYLGGSGVGHLGLIDGDRVELSNLQRQVLHAGPSLGRYKAEAAAEEVRDLNPEVDVVPLALTLDRHNAMELLAPYDLVVDCSDNFATRYLVNDACHHLGKPLVHGSLFRFEGQVSVFLPGSGCYRCLYPQPPPPEVLPACSAAGVLAALPGIVGSIQAAETLKLLTGVGRPLVGRLLLHDALTMTFREVRVRRNPQCALCGDHPSLHGLVDYDVFVAGGAPVG